MDPKEIRRIQEIIRLQEQLRQLKNSLPCGKDEECPGGSSPEKRKDPEPSDYDIEEWRRLVERLKNPG